MQAAAEGGAGKDAGRGPDGARLSEDDFLRAIRRDLASVYTEVLGTPIPDRVATVLRSLEAAVQFPRQTYG
jgi:hypothetical protein